jgi:Lar family restriction alleviation protein
MYKVQFKSSDPAIGWMQMDTREFSDEFTAQKWAAEQVEAGKLAYRKCVEHGIEVDFLDDYRVVPTECAPAAAPEPTRAADIRPAAKTENAATCPFCGHDDPELDEIDLRCYAVICPDCGAQGPIVKGLPGEDPIENQHEAAAAWNRRVARPDQQIEWRQDPAVDEYLHSHGPTTHPI